MRRVSDSACPKDSAGTPMPSSADDDVARRRARSDAAPTADATAVESFGWTKRKAGGASLARSPPLGGAASSAAASASPSQGASF
jgi:hypothetical protein